MQTQDNYDADVLVIGAGMAGLSAARALAARGLRVLVLEAQNRIGGRILTQRIGDEVIELGAEFVHGRPPELLALIEEAGLSLVERTGSWLREIDGALVPDSDSGDDSKSEEESSHNQGDPFSLLEDLEDRRGPDLTFAEYLDQAALDAEDRSTVINFVEGFNAADHRIIGIAALGLQQKAEDAIQGDSAFHVAGGYDQLPAFLARQIEEHGGELRIDTAVHRLEWQPNRVVAITNQGTFAARRAIITIPIGVLQSGTLKFQPPLPEPVRSLLQPSGPIRMGHALRFTLIFRERFWHTLPPQPALNDLSFLISRSTTPSVWWTPHPENSNSITGWIGGPRSSSLAGLSSEVLAERACGALATLFHLDAAHIRSLLTGCFSHDWLADAHARGAYSYIAKDGLDAPGILSTPIADTLYFAGEHTTTDGHWGTVHAALSSGIRAAGQIA